MEDIKAQFNFLSAKINELTNKIENQPPAELELLVAKINELSTKIEIQSPKVEEYKSLSVSVSVPKDVSLDIFKTLPEFDGERNKYATWRSTTKTAISLLANHPTSMRYFEALMIIRNKVTGAASNILNNYNTAFNFDAIIDRLDFTYADKRPLYILEQELTVLQQNKMSMDQFFDKVNEKLNSIVNKINMTYKETETAKAFIKEANEKALRTFITGLSNRKGEVLYASKPQSLPEAYGMLQTIINDQERINYANRFNKNEEWQKMKHPQFRPVQQQKWRENSTENSQGIENWRVKSNEKAGNFPNNQSNRQQTEAMEVDQTSTAVNVERKSNRSNQQFIAPFKRGFSRNNSQVFSDQKKKFQRINNVQDDDVRTILEDEHFRSESDEEFGESSNYNSIETASIFLDK